MNSSQSAKGKFQIDTLFTATGVVGVTPYDIRGHATLVVAVEGVSSTNKIDVYGRILGQTTWTLLLTVNGAATAQRINTALVDQVYFNCVTYSASGTPKLVVSGFWWGEETTMSGVCGSGAANQVAYWIGATTLSGDSNLTWDGTTFTIGGNISWSGQILAANGTAAAPSYAFTNDPDTGIYRSAADTIGFSAGGSIRASLTTNQFNLNVPTYTTDGTALEPSMSFALDSNTGIYRSAADTIGISAGGVVILSVDGAAVTSAMPVVLPDGLEATPCLTNTGDLNTGVYFPAADSVGLSTGGTLRLTVASAAVTSTVPLVAPAGAVTAPSLTVTGDLNTGIYFPAADTVGVACGGVLQAQISGSSSAATGGLIITSGTGADIRSIVSTAGTVTGTVRQYFRNSDATRSFELDADFTGAAEALTIQSDSAGIMSLTRAGQIQAITSGNAATPIFSFFQDPDCGMYRIGANNIGLGVAGALVVDIAATGASVTGSVVASTTVRGTTGMRTVMSTANVSNPPTDAECIAAFGAAATVGAGYFAFIDDAGGHSNEYLVFSDGTKYWQVTATACA